MAVFMLRLPDSVKAARQNGVDVMVIGAASEAAAITAAKAEVGDDIDSAWDSAIATELSGTDVYLQAKSIVAVEA